jgi:TrmH family RNA methyltransferase
MKFSKYKKENNVSYALGATLTFELLKTHPEWITRIFIRTSAHLENGLADLQRICMKKNINIQVEDKPFNVLAAKGNCFVIAEFEKHTQKLNQNDNHIVLVNPSDAGNIGTIIRTAVGFNITNIAIIERTEKGDEKTALDFFDPKSVRASMGALFHINIEHFPLIEDYVNTFPKHKKYCFMLQDGSQSIHSISISEPYSLIFGNEATGLSDNYANIGRSVIIPQTNNIDSFNLSMAAGIAMYEFTKKDFNGNSERR